MASLVFKEVEVYQVNSVMVTPEGWRRLHDELAELESQRMLWAAETQAGADTDGGSDLSTGALIYQRIEEIERLLQRAEPVDRRHMVPGTVGVGSAVTVKWGEGDEETFMLVGPPEVSLRDSRISYESPVGRALVGRKAGDEIAVPVGQGLARLSVLHVAHDPAVL